MPDNYFNQGDIDYQGKEVLKIDDFNLWKSTLIDYCENDCKVLHQVLIKFKELVFSNWGINIEKYPTTPSLAFAIFRKDYMLENTIPITSGKVFNFIKKSFTGGSTDMFIPYGKDIRCYDVNSLYPFIMKNKAFPVGNIFKFEGDITILGSDIYFIADSMVKTIRNLTHPYLQIHYKTSNGLRTISPNGKFNMTINSPEYYNAIKDYKIQIKEGYYFKTSIVFDNYVTDLYNLRLKYSKGSPMNLTCKMLMNSLFGRFAMKPILSIQKFIGKEEFKFLTEKYLIEDYLDLGDHGYFVSYIDIFKTTKEPNISISIASAITAYSRVFMSKFKNNAPSVFKLFYSDTDSIFVDRDLPKDLIGNEIGQFKLEYIFKEVVFLGPKIYGGLIDNNNFICKIKGYKNPQNITLEDLKSLLNKNSKPPL